MRGETIAIRLVIVSLGMLAFVTGCSSGHKASVETTTTTGPATSTTVNPESIPNPIPFVVGEQIGLPNGWRVTVRAVHLHYTSSGLASLGSGQQYVAIDLRMQNLGPGTHTVSADRLFTLVDSAHHEHFVVPEPQKPNGIDGLYPADTARTGRIVFAAPVKEDLGLVLYGPRIGTQVSDFTIVPPTVPAANS